MFEQPTLARRVTDTVMDACIVQHDPRGQPVPGGEHTVHEAFDIVGFNGVGMRGVDQCVLAEIRCVNLKIASRTR
jgi:hypothetical protein